ncbi:hypothetical protein NUW58_g4464 [Xylaria curta]|uniref:Uncharacterized protein n=1 Tax=Xylaria curta TaxID=42375 RepID=A0ACC1P7K4_9PEZI|nr:hypothetical protein NUW58_g4464 [Xylaria curta]
MADTHVQTVAFFGASGGVGLTALKHTLATGRIRCVALCRNPAKLTAILPLESNPNLQIIQGNAHDITAVSRCLLARPGVLVDQVISTIGGAFNSAKMTIDDPEVCRKGIAILLAALASLRGDGAVGRPHIVVCSTTGISRFGRDIPIAMIPLYHFVLKVPHEDKLIMEDRLISSQEDYTIVRPSLMVSEEETAKTVRVGIEDPKTGRSSSAIGYTITKGDAGRWIAETLVMKGQAGYERKVAIYPAPESEIATDVDIIAIHGPDTDSPRTWTWKHEQQKQDVNWLEDLEMLPSRVPKARIFTYNWPADLFEPQDYNHKTIEEFARRLLTSVANRREPRPIVFIASCLGGVILMQALHMATDEYRAVGQATSGIIFLAAPFRGTSFKDVEWAEPGLKAWASFRNKYISSLLDHVKPNFRLGELLRHFTRFRRDNRLSDNVFTFYETGTTSLPHKISTWLPYQKKPVRVAAQTPLLLWPRLTSAPQLVDQASATLDIVLHPIPLDRPHVKMNKFDGPNDPDYIRVVEKVETVLRNIREGSPSMKAKEYIRINRYSLNHLAIQRLSGDLLPINQCYINLVITEHTAERPEKLTPSPFSLEARLNIEPPPEAIEITLPTLFQPRKIKDTQVHPRRILIHGRAGIGKTTLCKKIVYEFTYDNLWSGLFECVLWVPLRNLKLKERRQSAEYNFRALFRHEYFSQHPDSDELADALWRELRETKGANMLFLLDGLDEVSRDLEGNMQCFLEELLNQSNVIITTHPNTGLPKRIEVDLELDTIAFRLDQVNAYIESTFAADLGKRGELQSFLNCHPLIRGLMRIPIQLDILCYTWNDYRGTKLDRNDTQETMTAIYQRIEKSLWRKDAERLKKWDPPQMPDVHDGDIKKSMDDETRTLELLAFSGIYNDIIDFEPNHRIVISEYSNPHDNKFLIDGMLCQISFVRSSNPSNAGQKNYHFSHLTFQEYFGALYFVRQWKARQSLKCLGFKKNDNTYTAPTEFLCMNKYNPRYAIFWRFVAGLLTSNTDLEKFYQILKEPCDLLGAAYPRLISHCLSWSRLASKPEFPVSVMKEALQQQPRVRQMLLMALSQRQFMSEERARFIALFIKGESWGTSLEALAALKGHPVVKEHLHAILACFASGDCVVASAAVEALEGQTLLEEHHQVILEFLQSERYPNKNYAARILKSQILSEKHLQAIIALLENGKSSLRENAAQILESQTLSEKHLQAILALLKNESSTIRTHAYYVLLSQKLSKEYLQGIIAYLENDYFSTRQMASLIHRRQPVTEENFQSIIILLQHKSLEVRESALQTLKDQLVPEKNIQAIIACLDDEPRVRLAALQILDGQSVPEEHLQVVIAYLEHVDSRVRHAAVQLLQSQPATEEHFQSIAPYLRHRSSEVRAAALKSLEGQSVPEEHLQAVIACFEHEDSEVRHAAAQLLQSQPATEEHIQSIAPYLQHRSWYVRAAAFLVLGRQLAELKHHTQDILAGLKDEDARVKLATLDALKHKRNLSIESLQAIAVCLKDDMEEMRLRALQILGNQPMIPEELCWVIFKHGDDRVRIEAMEVLRKQPMLSEELCQSIVPNLKHRDKRIRIGALEVLRKQPVLSEEFCQAIALSLHDEDPNVRVAAIRTLRAQPALSEQFYQSIAGCLQDDSHHVRSTAAIMLCKGDLSLIPIESVKFFYRTILEMSFNTHMAWQEVGNVSHITIGYKIYECVLPAGFKEALRKAQKEVDAPSYIALDSLD